MNSEALNEEGFEPMLFASEPALKDKKIAIFTSYVCGDSEWMRSWEEACISGGTKLICGQRFCNGTPDDATAACKALSVALCK